MDVRGGFATRSYSAAAPNSNYSAFPLHADNLTSPIYLPDLCCAQEGSCGDATFCAPREVTERACETGESQVSRGSQGSVQRCAE